MGVLILDQGDYCYVVPYTIVNREFNALQLSHSTATCSARAFDFLFITPGGLVDAPFFTITEQSSV